MTKEEAIDTVLAQMRAQHDENTHLLQTERRERQKLADEIERIKSGAYAEDLALFGGLPTPQSPARSASLPFENPRPSAVSITPDQRAGWVDFLKQGNDDALRASMTVGVQPDGGYLVGSFLSSRINQVAFDLSPLRRLCRVETLESGDSYEEAIAASLAEAQWVGESETRGTTAHPELKKARIEHSEMFAQPAVSNKLLELSSFNTDSWLSDALGQSFAVSEATAFVVGNGVKRPRGFLTYDLSTLPDSTRPFSEVQYVSTGVNAGFAAGDAATDIFHDTVAALAPRYRRNAVWIMSRETLAAAAKLKDTEGRHIWQQSLQAGVPSTLLGYSVVEDENMPSIATNSLSIALADFRSAYLVVDWNRMGILRDPYTQKGFTKFYATRRVGGGLILPEACKIIKFGTS